MALTKVPGIGKKGAERIVLELRDTIGIASGVASSAAPPQAGDGASAQVRDALVGLGWSPRQADEAVEAVRPGAGGDPDVSALLRAALAELGR